MTVGGGSGAAPFLVAYASALHEYLREPNERSLRWRTSWDARR